MCGIYLEGFQELFERFKSARERYNFQYNLPSSTRGRSRYTYFRLLESNVFLEMMLNFRFRRLYVSLSLLKGKRDDYKIFMVLDRAANLLQRYAN